MSRTSSAPTACRSSGVPKTIDNDLSATDFTFGFHTAVQIATDAIDRLHTTAESHDRVMVVEVMGRHAGWIATYAGLAGGADMILVPEEPFDIDEVCEPHHRIGTRAARASRSSSSPRARRRPKARWSSRRATSTTSATSASAVSATASPTRSSAAPGSRRASRNLGHVLRGGSPTAYDRVIATRFGVEAIDAVHEGDFGDDGRAARAPTSSVSRSKPASSSSRPSTRSSTTPPPSSSASSPLTAMLPGAPLGSRPHGKLRSTS